MAEVIVRLEEQSATWGRAEVVEEVSRFVGPRRPQRRSASPRRFSHSGCSPVAEVVSLAGPLPAEPPVSLRRRDGMAAVERHGALRFSTRATLRREAAILEDVDAGRDAHAAVVDELTVERVLADPPLGGDRARGSPRAAHRWQVRRSSRRSGGHGEVHALDGPASRMAGRGL